jgi:hypothetical protein
MLINKSLFNGIWHALSIGAAVLTALVINNVIHFDHAGWLVLATFLCSQTTRGTPIRQGIIFCFTIILAVMLAAFLGLIPLTLLTYAVVASVFVISGYIVFLFRPLSNKEIFHFLLFVLVLAIASLSPKKIQTPISDYLLSIGLGAVIGIAFNQLFFSIRLNKFFFRGVSPLLKSLKDYSNTLTNNFVTKENSKLLNEQRLQIEKSMLSQYSGYPSWVYETGFNPGLRSSWRYFLINLEQVTEIYFVLDFFAQRHTDVTLLSEYIVTTMQKNEELLDVLIQYVEGQQRINIESDFTSDLTALEDALRRIVPNQIELLDISPDYISLTALVINIRDLRGLLLKLVMSLPS